MAAKVIKNGGAYSFQGLNITVTRKPKEPNTLPEEEEEIDDAEEEFEEELDDDEPANVDADGAPIVATNGNETPAQKVAKQQPTVGMFIFLKEIIDIH